MTISPDRLPSASPSRTPEREDRDDPAEPSRSEAPPPPSDARYRTLFEHAPIGIVCADGESRYVDANETACRMLGYSRDELVGMHASDIVVETEVEHIAPALGEIAGQPEHRREWRFRRKDGSVFVGDVIATRSPDGTLLGMIRDVTALKEREREIARIARLHGALNQINQSIAWATSRDELLGKVCRALVEHGGFAMAWIGWHDPDTHRLVPVAAWGEGTGGRQTTDAYVDDRREAGGPPSLAFRSGRSCIGRDPIASPRACAAFPITMSGQACGTLSVYDDQPMPFRDMEVKLLEEAATDISFALDNLAREEARRQAEQTVRSEKLFSDVMIDSMPGIVYFYNGQGQFLRWNRNFETVSGYSPEEIVRMHPLEFFAGEDKARIERRIAEVFAKGESSVQASFVARDGTATPYFFTGRRVQFNGEPCLVGVGIDISDRRRAEDRLAESERKYRELVEHANSIILRWTAEGRITFLNEFGQRFFGYSGDEIIGRHVMDTIVPPTDGGGRDLGRLMERIRASPEAFEQNVNENMRRNGERVYISWTNRVVRDAQGRVVEILSIGSDITAQRQAEAEREKRHRAEAADRIKSAFLATMSHELRTPLNSIIGFTGIVLQGLAGPLNAEQSKQLGMVRISARHLLALINDVLDISKIEAGQLEVARERFDLRDSIARVLETVKPQAEAKGLALRVDLAAGLGEAASDQRRFEQILLNLLSNAIKFTDRGEVALAAEQVADFRLPGADRGHPAIRLRVSDTGIGIGAEDLPNLFQPFRQIDSGLSRSHEGTGLGLAICQRLAALMGGEISAASERGKGSTFTVTLPLKGPTRS